MWTGEDKMDILRHELGSKKKSNCQVLTRGICLTSMLQNFLTPENLQFWKVHFKRSMV